MLRHGDHCIHRKTYAERDIDTVRVLVDTEFCCHCGHSKPLIHVFFFAKDGDDTHGQYVERPVMDREKGGTSWPDWDYPCDKGKPPEPELPDDETGVSTTWVGQPIQVDYSPQAMI